MPLRILFADDSMTAQNMGKKILTDAGYEVVAVSNGAAAVKKIAEQKPDIIILDVYMPGYSGLEVCEKVRASIETLKTPVLLTVGKMEPYKPEDASRVRADGVIIKPFEASDLLAIVKKLEERIVPKAPPLAEQTILLDRPPDFSQFEQEQFHAPHPEERSTTQPAISMPDHMASSAAFGDLLGMDDLEVPEPPAAVVVTPPPPVPSAPRQIEAPMSSEFEVTPASAPQAQFETSAPLMAEPPAVRELEAPPPVFEEKVFEETVIEEKTEMVIAVESAVPEPEPPAEAPAAFRAAVPETMIPEPAAPEPVLITHEPPPEVRHIEVQADPAFEVPNSAASIEVPHATEPALEPTLSAPVELRQGMTDPALVTDATAMHASFPTKFGVENPEPVPVGIAADVPELQATEVMPAFESAPEPEAPIKAEAEAPAAVHLATEPAAPSIPPAPVAPPVVEEDDFEARVARAMSVYEQSVEAELAAHPEPVEIKTVAPPPVMPPQAMPSAPVVEPMRAPEPAHIPVIHAVPFEPVGAPSAVTPAAVAPTVMAPVAVVPEPVMPPAPPVVVAMPPAAPAPEPISMVPPPAPAPPVALPQPVSEVAHKVAAQLEAEIPAATTAVATAATAAGADNNIVATVVSRVMERLKPELIEEIMRELKDKK